MTNEAAPIRRKPRRQPSGSRAASTGSTMKETMLPENPAAVNTPIARPRSLRPNRSLTSESAVGVSAATPSDEAIRTPSS